MTYITWADAKDRTQLGKRQLRRLLIDEANLPRRLTARGTQFERPAFETWWQEYQLGTTARDLARREALGPYMKKAQFDAGGRRLCVGIVKDCDVLADAGHRLCLRHQREWEKITARRRGHGLPRSR